MPEELFAFRPGVRGGRGDYSRSDIRMAIMAIRRRFSLSDAQRQKMLVCAETIMDTSQDEKTKLLAVKMMAEMDKIDASREETEVSQRHHEVLEATAVLRAAMQAPDMREHLANLSDHVCKPLPIEEQKEIDQAHDAAAKETLDAMSRLPCNHFNGNGKP